jgi:hypothetical protein
MKKVVFITIAMVYCSLLFGMEYRGVYKNQHTYECTNGNIVSVFVNGNFINAYGGKAVSTTIHQDTVESAARKACRE